MLELPTADMQDVEYLHITRDLAKDLVAGPGTRSWTVRPAQMAYSTTIGYFLAQLGDRKHTGKTLTIAAHAGVGTGKTIGYMAPALRYRGSGLVVVATHTLLLMDQLREKDLPGAERITGNRPTVLVGKGQPQYLCFARLDDAVENAPTPAMRRTHTDLAPLFERGDLTWRGMGGGPPVRINLDQIDKQGLQSRYELDDVWGQLQIDRCAGRNCPWYAACPWPRHLSLRRDFNDGVLLTTHALLARDVAQRLETGQGLWPKPVLLIVDEADLFHDFMRRELAGAVSSAKCRDGVRLARHLRRVLSEVDADIVGMLEELGEAIYEATHESLRRHPDEATLTPVACEVRDALGKNLDAATAVVEQCTPVLLAVQGGERGDPADDLLEILGGVERLTLHYKNALRSAESVVWVERGRGRPHDTLNAGPTTLGQALRGLQPVLFTSGTMAPAGDFTLFGSTWGLDRAMRFYAPSPFDYERQMRYAIGFGLRNPADFYDRDRSSLYDDWMSALVPLLQAAGGRTLVLFTSRRDLEMMTSRVRALGLPFNVLSDIGAVAADQAARFKADAASVYLSTSAWQGLDVPGPGLLQVVIARLPYPVPDDPLVSAQQRYLADTQHMPEHEFTHRWMVQRLAQGAGRLIRNDTDRGVVAMLDPRAELRWEQIKTALPSAPVITPADARAFLSSIRPA